VWSVRLSVLSDADTERTHSPLDSTSSGPTVALVPLRDEGCRGDPTRDLIEPVTPAQHPAAALGGDTPPVPGAAPPVAAACVCPPGPRPRCPPRGAEALCGARASGRPGCARSPWGGGWSGVLCIAGASHGASSQASAVRRMASVPRIRKPLRAAHAALTPAGGRGSRARGRDQRPVWTPRWCCCRTCGGYGSPCPPCLGGVPGRSSAWSRPPAPPPPEAGPPPGDPRFAGARHAPRSCRASSACGRDRTPGGPRGVSPWLEASWGRGGLPGCAREKNLLLLRLLNRHNALT
jgi:hypothetical protein